jgi:hypothetical protein
MPSALPNRYQFSDMCQYGNTRTCHADFEQRSRPQIHLKCSVTQDLYTSKVPWVVAPNFDHLPHIYSNHPQNQTTCNSARLATSQTWKALSAPFGPMRTCRIIPRIVRLCKIRYCVPIGMSPSHGLSMVIPYMAIDQYLLIPC